MPSKPECQELERFKCEAASALLKAKEIRLSRDVSISEDFEMSRDAHARIYALIKHLLVGHDGHPCPAGDRPIVGAGMLLAPQRAYKWLSFALDAKHLSCAQSSSRTT